MASFLQTIFSRTHLLWPLLMGLGTAYLLSGAVYSTNALDQQIDLERDSLNSQARDRPKWTGLILEKNILNMEVPEQTASDSSSGEKADLSTWRLLGTFTGQRELALVSIQGQNKLLSPGQSIKGWELTKVNPRVTLWQSGSRTKSLKMWASSRQSEAVSKPNQDDKQDLNSPESKRIKLSSQEVQPLLQDPNALLQMAQFTPYTKQGKVQGFQIKKIQPESLLHQLGLQHQDILTRIDGQSISSPTDLLQAYSSLKQSSLVSLDILRQGQNINLVIEIAK